MLQASVIVSRGKKRIGYEIETRLNFRGNKGKKFDCLECAVKISDLCDDGSDPDVELYITKEGRESGAKFRTECNEQKVIKEIV